MVVWFCLAPTTLVVLCKTAVPFTSSIQHFSECCSSPQGSPLYFVRHVGSSSLGCQNIAVFPAILKMRKCVISLRPLLSSTSFKHDSNYRRLGVKTGAKREFPTGNPSPAPTHPHRTHDTTDQWRDIISVTRANLGGLHCSPTVSRKVRPELLASF